jgi:hypothetical protein
MSYVVKCVNPFLSSPMRKSQRLSRGRRVEANGKTPTLIRRFSPTTFACGYYNISFKIVER